jgi:hypothetical protein
VGVIQNKDRRAGILGLIITGVLAALVLLFRFC